jgi:ABC-type xylose transport system substrate-binding protein
VVFFFEKKKVFITFQTKNIMKKITSLFIILVFIFSGLSKNLKSQTDSVTVGFIMAGTFNDRWVKDLNYFEEKFNELGGKVIIIDCFDQVDNQIKAAEELVRKKVDGIVIVAIDAVASAPAVDVAHKAGIPVIAYDRMILDAPIDFYVSFNSVTVGEQMATAVINKLSKGNILYIGGPSEDYNSKFIRQGVFNVLEPLNNNFNLSSIKASTWNQMDSYLVFQDYLTNVKTLPDAIICGADVLVRGVIDVLIENDAVGSVIITGQDAELDICRMITRGEVEMTVYKPIKQLGKGAAEIMWNIIHKLEVETNSSFNNGLKDVPAYLLTPIVVNEENMDEAIIKDEYYTKEQIYGE